MSLDRNMIRIINTAFTNINKNPNTPIKNIIKRLNKNINNINLTDRYKILIAILIFNKIDLE